ncbi:MAG: metallophosphoesterase family protein [Kiritimatiellae bacterium]|jgi:predicted phosphodiesterase|nr:metallophosphoesterase family protein [Kiritimatiellia bacterium]
MRYAIISDVHANLTALQSVLNDISRQKIDKIICLGDTMGYGPQPVEALELIYQVAEVHLLGNHDAAVCGKLNPIIFSFSAKKAVLKHRKMISNQGLKWLESMTLTYKTPDFQCTHGDFSKPGAFKYIIEEQDAIPSWNANNEQLLFAGHTHMALIYVIGKSGIPHVLTPCNFIMEKGKRYIVNPGTVGYPRCGKFESTYCIYDTAEKSIVFRHLPFDYIGYNKSLKSAGLDEIPWVTRQASTLSLPDVRKRLSFTKPLKDEHHIIEDLQKLQHSQKQLIKKYRFLIIAILLITLVSTTYLIHRSVRTAKASIVTLMMPEGRMQSINAYSIKSTQSNFLKKIPSAIVTGTPIAGWRYIFENKNEQKIEPAPHISGNQLIITHSTPHKFILESPIINLAGTTINSIRMKGRIRKAEGFEGNVFYQLHSYFQTKDGSTKRAKVDSFEVRGRSNEGADVAAITRKIKLNKNTSHISLRIEADFKGSLELRQPEVFEQDNTIPANKEGNIP